MNQQPGARASGAGPGDRHSTTGLPPPPPLGGGGDGEGGSARHLTQRRDQGPRIHEMRGSARVPGGRSWSLWSTFELAARARIGVHPEHSDGGT